MATWIIHTDTISEKGCPPTWLKGMKLKEKEKRKKFKKRKKIRKTGIHEVEEANANV